MDAIDCTEIVLLLDILALKKTDKNTFEIIGKVPKWLESDSGENPEELDPLEINPYMESFLIEAESFWAGQSNPGTTLISDIWTDTDKNGKERHFEATAQTHKEENILLIKLLGKSYEEKLFILQKAREKFLEFEKLLVHHTNIKEQYDEILEYLR